MGKRFRFCGVIQNQCNIHASSNNLTALTANFTVKSSYRQKNELISQAGGWHKFFEVQHRTPPSILPRLQYAHANGKMISYLDQETREEEHDDKRSVVQSIVLVSLPDPDFNGEINPLINLLQVILLFMKTGE